MEKEIIGKEVKIVWEDKDKTQIREGKVLGFSNTFITILSKNREEMIPVSRILRIEVKGGGN